MKNSILVTPDAVSAFRDVVSMVNDERDAKRHEQAALQYREEREAPWWIDVGGEGDPC